MNEINSVHPDDLNFLIITANVGTLFENLAEIEKSWISELIKVVKKKRAHFIALHCQEIGGKDYKTVYDPVITFFENLSNLEELKDFTIVQSFLDGRSDNADQFTALGNVYMVHKAVKNVKIFDFGSNKFCEVSGKKLRCDKIKTFSNARKEKFDQDFFPECKWSRKGYIRARWKIYDRLIEFVNIHLFHDDSNLIAVRNSPSQYTTYRKRALKYVVNKLQTEYPLASNALQFVFGDFNFRLDVKSLIQELCASEVNITKFFTSLEVIVTCLNKHICPTSREQIIRSAREDTDDDVIRMLYRAEESNGEEKKENTSKNDVIVTLEKKRFTIDHERFQPTAMPEKLRCFDKEFPLKDVELKEYEITFPPTYPYSEKISEPDEYMKTRCPSWCDRVLLSTSTWDWMHSLENEGDVTYDVIGKSVCMGDHKPVYLAFTTPTTSSHEESATTKNGDQG